MKLDNIIIGILTVVGGVSFSLPARSERVPVCEHFLGIAHHCKMVEINKVAVVKTQPSQQPKPQERRLPVNRSQYCKGNTGYSDLQDICKR
jgi:hypothetical protein